MKEPANQLIERTQEAQDEVRNSSLEFLRDKLDYFNIKADFFENQTLIFNDIISKVELNCMEIAKEEQELTDKLAERNEVKKNLVHILEDLKNQRKARKHKKKDETFTRTDGFFHCPECHFKTKRNNYHLKAHINEVHRKLKPWKCSDCIEGKLLTLLIFSNFIDILF